jgi:hypothetical protein
MTEVNPMSKQEQKIMDALKPLRTKGLIIVNLRSTSSNESVPTGFEIMFHRIITDTTQSQIELNRQLAEAEGLTVKFFSGWGRAMYPDERGDRTLVCPRCGERYDWLATMLNLNRECEGLRQELKCPCGSSLKIEMVYVRAMLRYSVTVKILPAPRGEEQDETELARQLRQALEIVADRLSFGGKTTPQKDAVEKL